MSTRRERFCRCGCGESLAGMRADAIWRTDGCRKRAERDGTPDVARKQRAVRNGRGTKVYIVPGEVRENGSIAPSLLRKIREARKRIEAKR